MKYYIKVTCAFKWARKLPLKTETYESAKCVPCNTRKCTHKGFVGFMQPCPSENITLNISNDKMHSYHNNHTALVSLICGCAILSASNECNDS